MQANGEKQQPSNFTAEDRELRQESLRLKRAEDRQPVSALRDGKNLSVQTGQQSWRLQMLSTLRRFRLTE